MTARNQQRSETQKNTEWDDRFQNNDIRSFRTETLDEKLTEIPASVKSAKRTGHGRISVIRWFSGVYSKQR